MNTEVCIYYWPDGTWCYDHEYLNGGYEWKHCNYGMCFINIKLPESAINELVESKVSN